MNSIDIRNTCNKHGTPVYIYDSKTIIQKINELKNILPEQVELFYSIKANPLLALCRIIKQENINCEAASMGEIYTAIKAGFSVENIIFTGPGKTREEIEYALQNKIYAVNAESLDEILVINDIAKKMGITANVIIRINPDFNITSAGMKMTGIASQFGIDYIQIQNVFKLFKKLNNIKFIGIHVYMGTQILSSKSIAEMFENIFGMADDISKKYNVKIDFLGLGGGFGVPYFNGQAELELDIINTCLKKLMLKHQKLIKHTRIAVESGRYILADAGIYAVKVLYVKECKGKKYIICNGGSNHHAASAFLGRYIRNNFKMDIILKSKYEKEEYIIAGPLCTPTDIIGQKVMLPKAEQGDILVVKQSGAYGLTNSPVMFLSHPLPAEVIYHENNAFVARERGDLCDFLYKQKGDEFNG